MFSAFRHQRHRQDRQDLVWDKKKVVNGALSTISISQEVPSGPSERESRSFKATSDHTRGLFAGNVRSLSSLKFRSPLREIIRFSRSLWPLGTSCGLNIIGSAPFITFFNTTQGLDDVFGVEMLRTFV